MTGLAIWNRLAAQTLRVKAVLYSNDMLSGVASKLLKDFGSSVNDDDTTSKKQIEVVVGPDTSIIGSGRRIRYLRAGLIDLYQYNDPLKGSGVLVMRNGQVMLRDSTEYPDGRKPSIATRQANSDLNWRVELLEGDRGVRVAAKRRYSWAPVNLKPPV
jgi:hypothetical protein